MSTLSLRNINKIYSNNVQAVFDFNLDIKDKEFIVLVGPSGCGKSTTLRMVAGLEDISSGELYIDENLVNGVDPKNRNIAMVFQSYALYPHMSVYGNISFALKLRKVPCPVYENKDDVIALEQKNKELFSFVNKINRRFKKHQDDYSILEQRQNIYNEIYQNIEEEKKILKQVIGIDEDKIILFTSNINKTQKKIDKINAKIAANKIKPHEEEAVKLLLEDLNNELNFFISKLEYYQNNEVPLFENRKLSRFEIDIEINKVAENIDLVKYLYRKPAALSGGQRQRVALGRAIVRKPKVFLMDEPLSNLDAKLRVQTRGEILKIHKRVGATTIYVTHDQTEAMTMADRIVIMKDGYVQQIGCPKDVYEDPANKFVAGFIGSPSMNFLLGEVNKTKFTIKPSNKNEKEISIPLNKGQQKLLKDYEGKEIYLGARPECVYVKGDINNDAPLPEVKLECEYSELLGYERVIYSIINGQKLISKASSACAVNSGDKISICFNENKIMFFDKETELRIK